MLVRLAHRGSEPVRWSLDGDEAAVTGGVCRRRPPGGPTTKRPGNSGSAIRAVCRWRSAECGKHASTPRGRWAWPPSPEAVSQQGTLVVRSLGPGGLGIKNNRLKLLATEPPPADQYQTARATYQYDPLRDAESAPADEPAIVLEPLQESVLPVPGPGAAQFRSRYAADGSQDQAATYQVESAGRGRLRVTLPAGVTRQDVRGVWVDQGRVFPACEAGKDRPAISVDLPPGKRLLSVVLCFTLRRERLRAMGHLDPPWPEVDCPVLARHWTVWLPPGYQACDFLPHAEDSPRRQWTWSQRLFGVLGRAADQPAFNPFRRDDWATAIGLAEPAELPGWTVYRLQVSDMAAGRLAIVHGATIQAIGWLVFLLTAAAGLWRRAAHPAGQIVLAAALGIAALVCPGWFAPIAAAAFLAILFCLLARLLGRVRGGAAASAEPGRPDMPSTVTGPIPFAVPVLLLAACRWAIRPTAKRVLRARRPLRRASSSPRIAAGSRPAASTTFPSRSTTSLYRRAAARAEKPQGWLITAATYRGSVTREAASQRLVVDQLTAEFTLRVFDAAARVRIPFQHAEAKLLPDESRLDGHTIQSEWDADGSALTVEVAEPGEYRLELALRPSMRGGGFDLTIPRLATSRLELGVPVGAASIEVPRAVGAVRREAEPSRLVAELGPAERLIVRWQEAAGETASAVDVEQLLWLRVLPGSVEVLDARLRLSVVAGQLRRLSLAADPQLRAAAAGRPPSAGGACRAARGSAAAHRA